MHDDNVLAPSSLSGLELLHTFLDAFQSANVISDIRIQLFIGFGKDLLGGELDVNANGSHLGVVLATSV